MSGLVQSPTNPEFQRYDLGKTPKQVRALAEQNRDRETFALVEANSQFWIVLTRGEKRTGGYDVRVDDIHVKLQDNGSTELVVSYKYIDPAPGMIVTQVLSYPAEIVLLKGLSQRPDKVKFIKLNE